MTPPESPPDKSGWLDRVLELGNSNKLIAVATLITVATGVPYLVNVVLDAFGADEPAAAAPPQAPVITAEMLAAAMAESMAQVREQAERAAAEGAAQAQEEAVAAADRALEALGEQAARPEATHEERERIMTAYQQYATGNLGAALDEFARVATGQEERGATEQAAETWRHRGAIQFWADNASSLEDYRHAEELAPGNASQTMTLARLYLDQRRIPESLEAIRRSIRLARDEQDLETLAQALFFYAINIDYVHELDGLGARQEMLDATDEGIDVLEELLEKEPYRVRLIGMQAQLMRNSVAYRAVPELLGEYDDYLHARIAQVKELRHPAVTEAVRNSELGILHVLHGVVVQARGLLPEETEEDRREELLGEYRNALACAWVVLDEPRREVQDLGRVNEIANFVLMGYAGMGEYEGALEAVDCGLAAARENARVIGTRNGEASWMLGRARVLFEMGSTQEGIAQTREGLALKEASVDYFGQEGRAWFEIAMIRVTTVNLLPPDEEAVAEEMFSGALEIAETRLDEDNRKSIESAVREARDAFAARAAGEVSG